jgi:spermidine/putrescine transport system substrate-binding protein
VLRPDIHKWVAENILYKVPNQKAMEALDPALATTYPNIGMTPAELMSLEQMRDLGDTQKDYTQAVTEITSAQ